MSSDTEKKLAEACSLVELGKNDEARFCLLELYNSSKQNRASSFLPSSTSEQASASFFSVSDDIKFLLVVLINIAGKGQQGQ